MKIIPDYDMKDFGFEDFFGKNLKGWAKDRQGYSTGGWGLTLSARDMLRFGFLYLNDGIWNNKRIISKSWIEESVKMNSNEYGYLWWLCKKMEFCGIRQWELEEMLFVVFHNIT